MSTGFPPVTVVSMLGGDPQAVRGHRTRWIASELERHCEVALIPDPMARVWALSDRTLVQRAIGRLLSWWTLDPFEGRARKALREAELGEGAVLIGYPFSAVHVAARSCVKRGTPYVVDTGDPWVLTAGKAQLPPIARWRARRAEKRIYRDAAGVVFTTEEQAARMLRLFPHLATLVRPNGTIQGVAPDPAGPREPRVLKLVHYGSLYASRLGLQQVLRAVVSDAGRWDRVEFHQFGAVSAEWADDFDALEGVELAVHAPVDWEVAQRTCRTYDAAIVVGNADGSQLPSKAISYGSLGLPRLALVGGDTASALARFASEREGWLVVSDGTRAHEIADFLERDEAWSHTVPAPDLWPNVARTVADFCLRQLFPRHGTT